MGGKAVEITEDVAHKIGIPTWGLVAIIIAVCLVILGICFFCIRRCCRKRRSKDGKKGMKGVDLKSVQLLGSAYKEKVCNGQKLYVGVLHEHVKMIPKCQFNFLALISLNK